MIKVFNFDIVFQEIPDEISLALNLSLCPNHCKGCHSPWLWQDVGVELSENTIDEIISPYKDDITCLCFMGGDNDPEGVNRLAAYLKSRFSFKIAWYSGREEISKHIDLHNFDYIKLGAYIQELGPLSSPTSNQHLYKINDDLTLVDLSFRMRKKM